jgi:GAF domain-containing protein
MAALDDGVDHRQTIAALRRELNERTAERDEALAQQLATSEILGLISRSPTDTQPVFEAIVARAAALCEAEFSAVARLEDGLLHLVAVHSMSPEETAAFHSLFPRPPARNFTMGRAFVDARPVHFDDVLSEPDYDTRTLELLQSVAKYRSFLGVPILREGTPIGVIGCGRREVKPFTAAQVDLVKTFADQAAIAIEDVRLFGELEIRNRDLGEALEQQTATAQVLQVINSSPGDLAPVFDAMLEKAIRLCGGVQGSLWTFDGNQPRFAASRGLSAQFVEILRDQWKRRPPSDHHPMARLTRGVRLVQILDIAASELYRTGDPAALAAVELGSVRTLMFVALVKDAVPLGAFIVARREVRPFSDKQIALLENFAAQAVITMENARLLTDTREALEQQTATTQVLQVINSSPGDLTPVFDAMVESAVRLCEADEAAVRTFDGKLLHLVAAHGEPDVLDKLRELGPSDLSRPGGLYDPFLRGERVVHIADVRETETFRDKPIARKRLEVRNIRTWLAVALRREGKLLGIINVHRHEVRPFSEKQIVLLESFAAQAVIAMENARLLTETREALEQQTATAEVLQVINSSPGDLTPVFDRMLDKALHLCGAAFGILWTYDGEWIHAAAIRGATAAYAEFLTSAPYPPGRDNAHGRLLRGERFVHIADAEADAAYRPDDPLRRATVELGKARTILAVPLRKDEVFLGDIVIYRREVQLFSEKQIALLENFAAQAVIAMENARLITETRQALEQQTATAEVLQVINASPGELAPVFEAMLDKALRLCNAAFGCLFTYDGDAYHTVSARGLPPEFAEIMRQPLPPGPGTAALRVARGEPFVHIADLTEDKGSRPGNPMRWAMVEMGAPVPS